jgi:ABC-type lipoprotein export system ATPase subunit
VTHDQEIAARASRRLHVLDGTVIDPHAVALAGSSLRMPRAALGGVAKAGG